MIVFNYSQARQNFANVLDKALEDGEVHIKRRNGQMFVIKPERKSKSPFDVPGINLNLSKKEILNFIHEGRKTS
ncbi:hypothetical protein MNBD_UNCLBAC01-407 [hydrothermal vent metagenome]|uniref:Antitoxin n=1 Tax=hydrothermal vent metagenome TaxID=652676 RepID=A0A3B1D6S1_9ZZZZ